MAKKKIVAPPKPAPASPPSEPKGVDPNWPRDLNTRLDRLRGAELEVCVEMGRKQLSLEQIVNFEPGSVIELEKLSGMPMEILVNGTLFGRGEVVVVGDSLAIRITELFKTE